MCKWLLIICFMIPLLSNTDSIAQSIMYLLPGQGGDERLFQNIAIENHEVRHIKLEVPEKNATLEEYAHALSTQIDTTQQFSLLGVSFGGMIAVEMAKFLKPETVIIISSAKSAEELPMRYQVARCLSLHKLMGGKFMKRSANLARILFEPDSKSEAKVFKAMIKDLDPTYLVRAIDCVFKWKNTGYPENIIHIHGEKDHTIPIRNVVNPIVVKNGSHMMVLTEGEKISSIINEYLCKT